MKKLIFLLLCSCFLLPVPQVAAHGDSGAVLLALGMRKALETFAKKFELATATGIIISVVLISFLNRIQIFLFSLKHLFAIFISGI